MSTKIHVDSLGDDVLALFGAGDSVRQYRILDLVGDAVPGQVNTYYVDLGDYPPLGVNVVLDADSIPRIRVLYNGQEMLWLPQGQWTQGFGDFDIVHSTSSGVEGHAAPSSTNAIKFSFTPGPTATIWYHYSPLAPATP